MESTGDRGDTSHTDDGTRPADLQRARRAAGSASPFPAARQAIWWSLPGRAARSPVFICLLMAAPFLPGVWRLLHAGIPDVLFTGDGAVIEIRTLHAAHGKQLLGPYSRFFWSHPGPAFFYLALPVYQLFGQRGPALNLFAFLANLACAITLGLAARRLRGQAFAVAVSLLFGIYVTVGAPMPLWGDWNPVVPILPLALLGFLAARAAMGSPAAVPGSLFVASAIVQTHLGYLPVAGVLLALAALFHVGRRAHARLRGVRGEGGTGRRQVARMAWVAVASFAVLAVCWAPPIYENVTSPAGQGNLSTLLQFFTASHPTEHTWTVAINTVAYQLALMPMSIARVIHPALANPGPALSLGLAIAQLAGLLALCVRALWRRDAALAVLALLAMGAIITAVTSVRAIRGTIHPYLVIWMSVPGFLGLAAFAGAGVDGATRAAARLARAARAWATPRRRGDRAAVLAGLSAVALMAVVVANHLDWLSPALDDRNPDVESLAPQVERFVRANHLDHPVVAIASPSIWPLAMAVVLRLYKDSIPIFVEKDWLFMAGHQFASDAAEHPVLSIGDREFEHQARQRPDHSFVAAAGGVTVFLRDPAYARRHRTPGAVQVLSATDTLGDTHVVVDGLSPPDGAQWDGPGSLILRSTNSVLEVAVPAGDLVGVVLSVDGNDAYAIRCALDDGFMPVLGTTGVERNNGMRTRLIFTEELRHCHTIQIFPDDGDGSYSVGEVAFLGRQVATANGARAP